MDSADFDRLIGADLLFDVAEKCHLAFRDDVQTAPLDRVMRVLDADDHKSRLIEIAHTLDDNESDFRQFLNQFVDRLSPFLAEPNIERLAEPDMVGLYYARPTDVGAAWHNLNVKSQRQQFRSSLVEEVMGVFPHWDAQILETRLARVPPLALLNDEFTTAEIELRSALTVEFVETFLRASYKSYFGTDPLPALFPKRNLLNRLRRSKTDKAKLTLWTRLGDLFRRSHPRFTSESYEASFRRLTHIEPFATAYRDNLSTFATVAAPNALHDMIMSIMFPLSIPYAHSIFTAPGFIEEMRNTDVMASMRNDFYVMTWTVESQSYVLHFANPLGQPINLLEFSVPAAIEFLNYRLEGTYSVELHTPLD